MMENLAATPEMPFAQKAGELICRDASGPARAYDHHGQGFSWRPSMSTFERAALDVESKDYCGAETLRLRFKETSEDFLSRWVATEVLAKLFDIPILLLIKRNGLIRKSPEWRRTRMFSNEAWLLNFDTETHCFAIGYVKYR